MIQIIKLLIKIKNIMKGDDIFIKNYIKKMEIRIKLYFTIIWNFTKGRILIESITNKNWFNLLLRKCHKSYIIVK